jgi:hypothetical protein
MGVCALDFNLMLEENDVIVPETIGTDVSERLTTDTPDETEGTEAGSPRPEKRQTPTRSKRKNNLAPEQVIAWFAACARCSFFLAGYWLEQGANELAAATESSRAGWLTLNWNQSICKLLRKSYGGRVDMDCYHYDGSCPECHRQFVYHVSVENDSTGRFRIELRPGAGR